MVFVFATGHLGVANEQPVVGRGKGRIRFIIVLLKALLALIVKVRWEKKKCQLLENVAHYS